MSLLVIGGTGTLGRQIVRLAVLNGYKTKCLVRNVRRASFLKDWGAEIIYGDLTYPESLVSSLLDVNVIIDASTSRLSDDPTLLDIDWTGKVCLLKIAKKIGIKRYIYISPFNKVLVKDRFEEYLSNSKVPFTFFYLQGFFQGIINQYAIPILENQPIVIDRTDQEVSYIDSQDVAKIILQSLNNSDLINSKQILQGNTKLTPLDIIKICESLSGQKANLFIIPGLALPLSTGFCNFFQFSWSIADRLNVTSISKATLRNIPVYEHNLELQTLENYLQEYFSRILVKLKELNYDQSKKRKDLTF